jgi:biopolymer transport protein ExbD
MAKKRQRVESGAVSPDMTPMIDCVFQLIIFFMLTAQMASEQSKLILPTPHKTQAVINVGKGGDKVEKEFKGLVINVPNALGDDPKKREGKGAGVLGRPKHIFITGVGEITISNHDKIKVIIQDRMKAAAARGTPPGKFFVELRVDKDIHWRYVQPLMMVASEAGASKVVFTAIADKESDVNQ